MSKCLCTIPFERIEISPDGEVYNCCSSWLRRSIGNIFQEDDFEKIWNSTAAREIRASILDESYRYCSRDFCTYLLRGRYKPKENDESEPIVPWDSKKTIHKKGPSIMALNYDRTCNLHCTSCRREIYVLPKEKAEALHRFQEKLINSPVFQNVRELIVTGSGDPFASKVLMSLLQNIDMKRFPKLRITLRTNGMLFNAANWEKLANVRDAINFIKVSIDAATKETYEKLRRGGNFEILMKNMDFLREIKQNREIRTQAFFLMQVDNYKEIPDFIRMMKSFDFTYINLAKINNWDTFSPEEFNRVAVHQPDHPEHEQFLRVLADPVVKDPTVTSDITVD